MTARFFQLPEPVSGLYCNRAWGFQFQYAAFVFLNSSFLFYLQACGMSDFKLDVVLGQDFPEPGFRPEKGKTISGAEKINAAVYKIFSVNFAGRRAKSDG